MSTPENPPVIYLDPPDHERCWSVHDEGPCPECGEPWTKYIRADAVSAIDTAALVERLRARAEEWDGYRPAPWSVLQREAADAIEALGRQLAEEREQTERLRLNHADVVRRKRASARKRDEFKAERDSLAAELARVREALERIADRDVIYPPHDPGDYMPPKGRDGPFRKIARAALATHEKEDGR